MEYMKQRAVLMALVGGVGGVMSLSSVAFGQNALGDGRGLEANTRLGSGGRNYVRPSLEREIQFRNAIATGNAPGGMSFRGDLGYRAPGEFAGDLGSDSLYSFRRDSVYSGLAGMGIRGTDAIQYQFAMTTGSRVTGNLSGNLSVSRLGGSYISSGLATGSGIQGSGLMIDPEIALRQAKSRVSGILRSTASYSSTSGLVPELVTVFDKGLDQQPYGLVASPLMGLVSTPMGTRRTQKEAMEEAQNPLNTSYIELVEQLRARAKEIRLGNVDAADRAAQGMSVSEQDTATDEWIALQLGALQRQVLGLPEPVGEDDPVEVIQQGEVDEDIEDVVKVRDPMNPNRSDPEETQESGFGLVEPVRYEIDPKTLAVLRGDGKRVTYLVDPDAEFRNIYGEHMLAGQRLLQNDQFFDAEERFTSALSVQGGDVPAQLGRLHAQIGAGLVMSASVNLQTMMSEHLEIVSQRYSGELLPNEARLRELIKILRSRANLEERPSHIMLEPARVRIACGLMISYLGFQIDDKQQMQEGFDVVLENGNESDHRLVHLLQTVWGQVMELPVEESFIEKSEPLP